MPVVVRRAIPDSDQPQSSVRRSTTSTDATAGPFKGKIASSGCTIKLSPPPPLQPQRHALVRHWQ